MRTSYQCSQEMETSGNLREARVLGCIHRIFLASEVVLLAEDLAVGVAEAPRTSRGAEDGGTDRLRGHGDLEHCFVLH